MSQRRPKISQKATPERILDAAERLFARNGIEGVSLRQIGLAAGSSNHFSVQYHYGDKAQVVRAIFERRLPDLESRRARLLSEIQQQGRLDDPRALMWVFLRPIADQTDAEGRCSYASFMLSAVHHRPPEISRDAVRDLSPLSSHVIDLLHEANRGVPPAISRRRFAAVFALFLVVLHEHDLSRTGPTTVGPDESLLIEAVDMATAAFTLPAADAD